MPSEQREKTGRAEAGTSGEWVGQWHHRPAMAKGGAAEVSSPWAENQTTPRLQATAGCEHSEC